MFCIDLVCCYLVSDLEEVVLVLETNLNALLLSSFLDSTNSSENIYTMMNPIGPGGNRPNVCIFQSNYAIVSMFLKEI